MFTLVLRLARRLGGAVGRLAGARRPAPGGRRRGAVLVRRAGDRRGRRVPHQLWLLWLGSGLIGGVGLGLGYISPVSTLIKWFPDRRGMATGMAIMGFGGGAMIGAPLANMLMNYFRRRFRSASGRPSLVLAAIYFVFMLGGAFGYRVPPAGWRPEGWTPPATASDMITHDHVHLDDAHKTPQFWLIWGVLCMNVSAGIGVLGMASPMLQEIFGGALIGHPEIGFTALDDGQKTPIAGDRRGLCRFAVAVQHRRPVLLGLAVGPDRPQGDLFRFFLLGIALYALRRRSRIRAARRCSWPPSASSCRCMAAASPPCRPIWPTCSAPSSSARSMAGC